MTLALATVVYEWRRYLAAVVALAFAGLLILSTTGMFVGIGKAFTATIDRSPAELMILPPKSESLINGGGLPRRVLPMIYLHPEVLAVQDMDDDGGMFSNLGLHGKKKREYISIQSVDTAPDSLTWPTDFPASLRETLSEPYAIAVDESTLGRLGVQLGDRAALDGHAITIAATITGYPNMMQPQIVVSRQTLRLLGKARPQNRVGPMFVRISDPQRAPVVRDQLNAMSHGEYRAWTRQELSAANDKAMMKEQLIGLMLGFFLFLGLLIGLGITSQTLRGAILANIKEFASLRALGVSVSSLRLIVLELSLWVGIAGLGATAILVGAVALLAKSGGVPMAFPIEDVVKTAVFLLATAMISGAMALGVLKKSQPADLLR